MPVIKLRDVKGIIPKLDAKRLPENCAQTAQNVDLSGGNLAPLKGLTDIATLSDALQSTIYRRKYGTSSYHWLNWNSDVDVVRNQVVDETDYRIYYTEGGVLKIKYGASATPTTATVTSSTPSTITATVYEIFDPVTYPISLTYRWNTAGTGVSGSATGDMISSKITKDGLLEVKFKAYKRYYRSGTTWYDANPKLKYIIGMRDYPGSYSYIPSSGGSLTYDYDAAALFSETMDWDWLNPETSSSETVAHPKVLSFVEEDFDFEKVIYHTTTQKSIPHTVTFIIDMGWIKAQTTKSVYYVQTAINASTGWESPPSAVSNTVDIKPGSYVRLTNLGVGNYVYRSAAGSEEDAFFYMFTATRTTYYADTFSDAELGESLYIVENPPNPMYGLVGLPNAFMAAFYKKDLYFSEPNKPYSWPTEYRLTCDYDIVGLAASGNDLVVLTTGFPYLVTGTHPEFLAMTKLPHPQACSAKRSICSYLNAVFYASPDGIALIENGNVKLLTEQHYSRDQWQALTPSGIIGGVHDSKLYLFYSAGAIIYDLRSDPKLAITTTNETIRGLYSDAESDTLYVIQSNKIKSWATNATVLTATWKSKKFELGRAFDFSCARVTADAYTAVYLTLIANGTTVVNARQVTDGKAFRLPIVRPERFWEVQIQTTSTVDEIVVSTAMETFR